MTASLSISTVRPSSSATNSVIFLSYSGGSETSDQRGVLSMRNRAKRLLRASVTRVAITKSATLQLQVQIR